MSRDSVFRVLPRRVRASGAELQGGRRQRQPEREVQAGAGRDGTPGDGEGRQREARGSGVQNTTSAEVRSVVASLGINRFAADALSLVLRWYDEQGFFVLPCNVGEKRPSIDWREYTDTTSTPPAEGPWHGLLDKAELGKINLAVLCGEPSGGLVCLDFDDKEKGLEHPLNTLTVRTGKGIHYYVRVTDAEIRNRSFPDASLDIRGQGGIAILPPSIHPSGRVYRFERVEPVADISKAQLDAYLAAVLGQEVLVDEQENEPGWFEHALGATCEEGSRNNSATALAGRLIGVKLATTEVVALLSLWSELRCVPPLPVTEILATVRSIARKHYAKENRVQPATEPQPNEELEPGTVFTQAALTKRYGSGYEEAVSGDGGGAESGEDLRA